MPQSAVTVTGFKPQTDGTAWLVKTVEHSLGDGGFTTSLEMELPGSGEIGTRSEGSDDEFWDNTCEEDE
jgi:hypothetical protein